MARSAPLLLGALLPLLLCAALRSAGGLEHDSAPWGDQQWDDDDDVWEQDEFEEALRSPSSSAGSKGRMLTAVCEMGCERIKEAHKKAACKKGCQVDDEHMAACVKQCGKGVKAADCIQQCLKKKKPAALVLKPHPPPKNVPVTTFGAHPKLAKPLPKNDPKAKVVIDPKKLEAKLGVAIPLPKPGAKAARPASPSKPQSGPAKKASAAGSPHHAGGKKPGKPPAQARGPAPAKPPAPAAQPPKSPPQRKLDSSEEGWSDEGEEEPYYGSLEADNQEESPFDNFETLKSNYDVCPRAYVRSLFAGVTPLKKVSRQLYWSTPAAYRGFASRRSAAQRLLQEEGGAEGGQGGGEETSKSSVLDNPIAKAATGVLGTMIPVGPDTIKAGIEAALAAIPTPKRPDVIDLPGFKLRAVQGMQYQAPKMARQDKNLEAFMAIVTRSCNNALQAKGISFDNLKTRQQGDDAFQILDDALYKNPFAAASFHNEETNKRLSRSSTDFGFSGGGAGPQQRKMIEDKLKEMINDDEIFAAFSSPNTPGADKIDMINNAYSQTGAAVSGVESAFKGSASQRVHAADLAYIKFPSTTEPKSRLKLYFVSVDAWFASERILFVSKTSAGLDFHMRRSEYMVDNERIEELDPVTKDTLANFLKNEFKELRSLAVIPIVSGRGVDAY